MRRVCWSGWLSAALLLGFVLLASGCQVSEPLVPASIQQEVNADDRERNYDLAWQEIRGLAGDIERGELATLEADSLLIASRMERLQRGEASGLSSRPVASQLADWESENQSRSEQDRLTRLRELSQVLPEYFDPGDFADAQDIALEIYVIARSLEP
jgi:hypothetical protein